MRRRVAPAARTRPMVPVAPTADGAASYSAVQLRRGPRAAHGPSWSRGRRCPAEHAARCRSCRVADGAVNQVGPSGTAHGSSELVKAHTPRRGRPSCRNSAARAGHAARLPGSLPRSCLCGEAALARPDTRSHPHAAAPAPSRRRRGLAALAGTAAPRPRVLPPYPRIALSQVAE
jgi:hypothetical protein